VPFSESSQDVKGSVLQEITQTGKAIWNWSTFDHLDTSHFPGPTSRSWVSESGYDWTHANSVDYVKGRDAVLLSVRNHHHVVLVSRKTGRVVWRLGAEGDFSLVGAGEWFFNQHDASWLVDGSILLYDNGNERPGDTLYSRAVIYKVDEQEMSVRQVWEYRTEVYTPFLGGAQLLHNGNVLVHLGGRPPNAGSVDTKAANVVEVTQTEPPEKVWELAVSDQFPSLYKASRYCWRCGR